MRRLPSYGVLSLFLCICTLPILAQSEKLVGRWEGKTSSAQGERETTATFKQEGAKFAGTITGMRADMALKEIKVEGNKITASAEVQAPQGALVIRYTFTLEGDVLSGKGALDFNGSPFEFDVNLKRVASTNAAQSPTPTTTNVTPPVTRAGTASQNRRPAVPQPQQKISLSYFVGAWDFEQKGRDSAVGDGVRTGTITFKQSADSKSVTGQVSGTKETITIHYDETTKAFILIHKYATGVSVNLKGEWTTPIAIRTASEAVKIKGETLKLRRLINIVAAHSFTIFDEIAEGDGAFVRLSNAVFSRAETK